MHDDDSEQVDCFAAELRAQRVQRGWTQVETGDKIGYSSSYISDLERGGRGSTLPLAQAYDQVFGLPETFVRLHKLARRAAYPSFFAPVVELEQEAVRIHLWQLGAVPGLLQTEDYARALIQATRPQDSTEAVERLVTGRMERQQILRRGVPPRLWYLIDEAVLRRVVGGIELMAAQLDLLISAAQSPGVVLQVVPFNAKDHAGSDGPIEIYEFANRATIVYAECNRGGRIVEDPDEVADLATTMNMIRASALAPRDTRELLIKARSELDD